MAGQAGAGDVAVFHIGITPGGYKVTGFAVIIGSDMVRIFTGGAHAIVLDMAALTIPWQPLEYPAGMAALAACHLMCTIKRIAG